MLNHLRAFTPNSSFLHKTEPVLTRLALAQHNPSRQQLMVDVQALNQMIETIAQALNNKVEVYKWLQIPTSEPFQFLHNLALCMEIASISQNLFRIPVENILYIINLRQPKTAHDCTRLINALSNLVLINCIDDGHIPTQFIDQMLINASRDDTITGTHIGIILQGLGRLVSNHIPSPIQALPIISLLEQLRFERKKTDINKSLLSLGIIAEQRKLSVTDDASATIITLLWCLNRATRQTFLIDNLLHVNKLVQAELLTTPIPARLLNEALNKFKIDNVHKTLIGIAELAKFNLIDGIVNIFTLQNILGEYLVESKKRNIINRFEPIVRAIKWLRANHIIGPIYFQTLRSFLIYCCYRANENLHQQILETLPLLLNDYNEPVIPIALLFNRLILPNLIKKNCSPEMALIVLNAFHLFEKYSVTERSAFFQSIDCSRNFSFLLSSIYTENSKHSVTKTDIKLQIILNKLSFEPTWQTMVQNYRDEFSSAYDSSQEFVKVRGSAALLTKTPKLNLASPNYSKIIFFSDRKLSAGSKTNRNQNSSNSLGSNRQSDEISAHTIQFTS